MRKLYLLTMAIRTMAVRLAELRLPGYHPYQVRLAHGRAVPVAHVAWRRASAAGDAHGAAALLSSLVALQSRLLRAPLPPALRRALGGAQHADRTQP